MDIVVGESVLMEVVTWLVAPLVPVPDSAAAEVVAAGSYCLDCLLLELWAAFLTGVFPLGCHKVHPRYQESHR